MISSMLASLFVCMYVSRRCTAMQAKELDDGWPESVEEQGLLLFVLRHYIIRQYKDAL